MTAAIENNEMAWVGEVPWHGLGHQLEKGKSLVIWAKTATLDWKAEEHDIYRFGHDGDLIQLEGKKALVRSDSGITLGIVHEGYKPVQPSEVLGFYRSLIEDMGYQMETAGNIRGGKRIWALARTGRSFRIMGQDDMREFLLLATSFDGTMASTAKRTSVRVVCNNTLELSYGMNEGNAEEEYVSDIRIPHVAQFNSDIIKGKMGLEDNAVWKQFQEDANLLAARKVKPKEAIKFFLDLFYGDDADVDVNSRGVQSRMKTMEVILSNAPGQGTKSANGTAWGLVNAVTRWSDHERSTRTVDARLERAWFGDSAALKKQAMQNALKLAA